MFLRNHLDCSLALDYLHLVDWSTQLGENYARIEDEGRPRLQAEVEQRRTGGAEETTRKEDEERLHQNLGGTFVLR